MEREHTCCFTGHRPDKLPWGTGEQDPRCLALKARLDEALERAYLAGCRHFICGMARGSDLYFAEAVLALRELHPEITLEGARPCETQADGWPLAERNRYFGILERCDYETLVQHHYDRAQPVYGGSGGPDHRRLRRRAPGWNRPDTALCPAAGAGN